jgi:hypothetical protein
MNFDFSKIDLINLKNLDIQTLSLINIDFIYQHYLYIPILLALILLIGAIFIDPYKRSRSLNLGSSNLNFINTLSDITLPLIFPLTIINKKIKTDLELIVPDNKINTISTLLTYISTIISFLLLFFLIKLECFWYLKVLFLGMSIYIPLFLLFIILDLKRNTMNKLIPEYIDLFRSNFIEFQKIIPALKRTSSTLKSNFSTLLFEAANSSSVDGNLIILRGRINNVWFNIFVTLLLNFKENGGELTKQLYKLNNSITKQLSIDKKKSKRLVLYEFFCIGISVFSIPIVMFVNKQMLGETFSLGSDAKMNSIMAGMIVSSVVGAIIIRFLRKGF